MLYCILMQLLYTYTERERERYEKIQTIHIIAGCFSLNHPTNLTLELLHLSGQMSQHCLCTVLLATARATLAFLQGLIELLASSFFNEACGKSIFVLDILDQPLHIFTIPCICVMCKNHQVLESGHHHNVHGRHHIYDFYRRE